MTGMVIHATVGAIWAIFYAYFFWSIFDWPPAFQGMAFSLLPTLLALFIAYPHLQMMPLDVPTALFTPLAIIRSGSWQETFGLLTGQLIFGGAIGRAHVNSR